MFFTADNLFDDNVDWSKPVTRNEDELVLDWEDGDGENDINSGDDDEGIQMKTKQPDSQIESPVNNNGML